MSDLIQPLDVVVTSRVGILGSPKRLSVVRIAGTASKVLLLAVIHYWQTFKNELNSHRVVSQLRVGGSVSPSRKIMVFDKVTDETGGRERAQNLSSNVDESGHVAVWSTESIHNTVVERVAKDGVHPILGLELGGKTVQDQSVLPRIGNNHSLNVVCVDLAHAENTGSTAEPCPELSGDVLGSIDT